MAGEDVEGPALALLGGEFEAAAGLEESAGIAHAPGDDVVVEIEELLVKQALVPVANADDGESLVDPGPRDGADGRVHAGGIAAGGEDCNAFHNK